MAVSGGDLPYNKSFNKDAQVPSCALHTRLVFAGKVRG